MLGNLRQIANNLTQAVNPNVPATLYSSNGFSTVNYTQIPSYLTSRVFAQVQPITTGDALKMDALNIQGVDKIIFLNGLALAINRIKKFGGDLVVFADGVIPEGNTWLIKANLEQWSDTWCKIAVVLQDDLISGAYLKTDLTDPNNQTVVPAVLTGV